MTNKTILTPVGFSVNQGALFFTHDDILVYNGYSNTHWKDCRYHDLFTLSDEEIKEDDYAFDGTEIFRCHKWDKEHKLQGDLILADFNNEILERNRNECKKIIASTDPILTPNNIIPKEDVWAFIDHYKEKAIS